MNTLLKIGTVFVQDGAVLPSELSLETESFSRGWKAVSNLDGFALGRKIETAKWHFFYLAGRRSATATGNEGQPAIGKAIVRIMGRLPRETYNSLEVTQIVSKRLLGIPYVRVFAHARHIQEEMQLLAPGAQQAIVAGAMKPANSPALTVKRAAAVAEHS